MRVRILKEAYEDIRDGRRFYDEQERGVGQYFSSTIYADIRSLRNFAGIHPRQYGYFKMLVRRKVSGVGKYLMFFHGSSPIDFAPASLGLAWSDDLKTWSWPGK